MLKRTLPNWNDTKGVAELGDEILAEHKRRLERFREYGEAALDGGGDPFELLIAQFQKAERDAVEAAERGDTAPLAALLRGENLDWLSSETRELIARLMAGKPEPGRGRPKMPPAERFAGNPIHAAAAEVQILQRDLQKFYPDRAAPAVRARALELAARRSGVDEEQLRTYCRRSRSSPQRL